MRTNLIDSPAAALVAFEIGRNASRYRPNEGWAGGSHEEAERAAIHGSRPELVARVVEQSERLVACLPAATAGAELMPAPAGPIPCVPALLAGSPMSAFRTTEEENSRGLVRIFASPATSGLFSAEELSRRGAAIAALVLAVQRIRPVELWSHIAVSDSGGSTVAVRIGCTPIDLGMIAAWLADSNVARRILYGLCFHPIGGNPAGHQLSHDPATRERLERAALGAAPTDVVVPVGLSLDLDGSTDRPNQWIADTIARLERAEHETPTL